MVEAILPATIHGAVVRKKNRRILGPIDLSIAQKVTTAVVGPNGSGKTTLLRLIHGLEKLHDGSVNWQCETGKAMSAQSFVFQSPIMLQRSTLENIIYPLKIKGVRNSEAKSIGHDWLGKVDLTHISPLSASNLSGGEKQKLAIARALVSEPQMLILDEPTANLDGTATREIEAILRDAIEAGVKIVLATHDMGQAKRLADEIVFLHRGKIHETATATSFFKRPKTTEARSFLNGEIVE